MKTLAAVFAFGLALDLWVMFRSVRADETKQEEQE